MKKILILFVLTLFVSTIYAQELQNEPKLPHMERRYTVAVQPLFWFNNAVRLDFEMRIKDTPAWLQISPIIYYIPSTANDRTYKTHSGYYSNWNLLSGDRLSSLFGAGIELNYKYFFNKNESWYFAGGCSYVHHNIDYQDYYFVSYMENNLEYHKQEYGLMNQTVNKSGANIYLGYQIPNKGHFLFDMFVGIGYRHSFSSNSSAQIFSDQTISYGYTGTLFITGVRLGVKLGK